MAGYSLEIQRTAARELDAVEPRSQRQRIVTRVRALAGEPRPAGAQRLAGVAALYLLRQGDCRILYEIDDDAHRVMVVRIGHRREVYR
ncbi:MAG: type II toxin-antitoxin system RelE/ParE family toxin [Thermoanaerobaculia bacterium]